MAQPASTVGSCFNFLTIQRGKENHAITSIECHSPHELISCLFGVAAFFNVLPSISSFKSPLSVCFLRAVHTLATIS